MDYISVINSLLHYIEMFLRDEVNYREDGTFKYVPSDARILHEKLSGIEQGKTFLDVGCGIGDKCLIAEKVFGLKVTGIEIDTNLIEIAKTFIDDVIEINAFDFNDYNKFDIIYMYQPYRDAEKQKQLSDLIKSKKKQSAIFIEV